MSFAQKCTRFRPLRASIQPYLPVKLIAPLVFVLFVSPRARSAMSAIQMQQVKSQAYACGRPFATSGSKTASTPDVRGPHHDPAAGWLQGGAPKSSAAPRHTAFPRIPEPGLLRVVVYTHFPETRPEESATFDFRDAHHLRLMGREGCLEYLQATLFGEVCARHRVPATPAGCDCCSGRYNGPAPVGHMHTHTDHNTHAHAHASVYRHDAHTRARAR